MRRKEKFKNDEYVWDMWSSRLNELVKTHPLRVIFWQTTLNCDSYCKYCSSPREWWKPNNELSTDEIIFVLEDIKKKFDVNNISQLSFTGGEPLLRRDLPIIAKKAKVLGFKNLAIQTNGLIAQTNPGLVEELINSGVLIWGVNIDGLKSIHNSFREDGDWFKNSYDFARRICNDSRITVTITTLVSKKNVYSIPEIYKLIYDLKPKIWRIAHFDPIGRGAEYINEYYLSKKNMTFLLSFIKRMRLENVFNKDSIIIELACGGWLGKKWEGLVRPYIFHCVSGINTMTILYDGSITGCPVVSDKLIQGNIRNDDIHEVWNNKFNIFRDFSLRHKNECLRCNDWKFCHGGPMHNLYRNENEKNKNFCLKI